MAALIRMAEAQNGGSQRVDPLPLLKLLVAQSGCFQIVDRGEGFDALQRERQLAAGGSVAGANNQATLKAADYLQAGGHASGHDYLQALERQVNMRLGARVSYLFSPPSVVPSVGPSVGPCIASSCVARPIEKLIEKPLHKLGMRRVQSIAGVPMTRRSVSMEALEVLASCMTK
jgi:hypothetical protein